MFVMLNARAGSTVSAERMMAIEDRMERLEGKIARGERFTEPAEDPAGHLRASLLARLDARLVAEQRTIDRAAARLSRAEVTMAEADRVLVRLRELAILGATGSMGDDERQVIAAEVRGLREQLVDLANTRDEAGRYLFAGALDGTPAYIEDEEGAIQWQGFGGGPGANAAGVAGAEVPPGPTLFGAGETSAFAAVDRFLEALAQPDAMLRGPALDASLEGLERAHDRIVGARARAGTALARLERESERVAQARLVAAEGLAAAKGLDLTQAIAELEALRLTLSASQAVFGRVHGVSLFDRLG